MSASAATKQSWAFTFKQLIDGLANIMCALIVFLRALKKKKKKKKGARAIVTRPTTRANTTSILGAISASGLITVGVKKKPRSAKKRKADGYISSGTVTGHYINFLNGQISTYERSVYSYG
ncbi:unnamed protein product [Rhizopus stolonifer]